MEKEEKDITIRLRESVGIGLTHPQFRGIAEACSAGAKEIERLRKVEVEFRKAHEDGKEWAGRAGRYAAEADVQRAKLARVAALCDDPDTEKVNGMAVCVVRPDDLREAMGEVEYVRAHASRGGSLRTLCQRLGMAVEPDGELLLVKP